MTRYRVRSRIQLQILIFLFNLIMLMPHAKLMSAESRVSGIFDRLQTGTIEQKESLLDSLKRIETPLVDDGTALFVLFCDSCERVTVAGDFNGWNPGADSLIRMASSDCFCLAKTFEADARLDYKFVLDGRRWILDPCNPGLVPGGFGSNSELRMPEYAFPSEILPPVSDKRGSVQKHILTSDSLKNERLIHVYLPFNYSLSERRYPVLIVHDGSEYMQLGSMVHVLDNLISGGKIPPLMVVFVDPVDRNQEYRFHTGFEAMILHELIPFIRSGYRSSQEAAEWGCMGASLGGLVSAWLCIRNPALFGFCASQSGAFWLYNRRLIHILDSADSVSGLRFYLDWGSYEPQIRDCNIALVNVLEKQRVPFMFGEFHEGHSWGSWRAHIRNALETFLISPGNNPSR